MLDVCQRVMASCAVALAAQCGFSSPWPSDGSARSAPKEGRGERLGTTDCERRETNEEGQVVREGAGWRITSYLPSVLGEEKERRRERAASGGEEDISGESEVVMMRGGEEGENGRVRHVAALVSRHHADAKRSLAVALVVTHEKEEGEAAGQSLSHARRHAIQTQSDCVIMLYAHVLTRVWR